MASIAPPSFPMPSARTDQRLQKFNFTSPKFSSSKLKRASFGLNSPSISSHFLSTTICQCNSSSSSSEFADNSSEDTSLNRRWDSAIQDAVRSAVKKFDDYLNSKFGRSQPKSSGVAEKRRRSELNEGKDCGDDREEWNWERWRKHFTDMDDEERIVSNLKTQLVHAVNREDYEEAARLKVAIAAAATNDTVGQVMSHLSKAARDERYGDAAFFRDHAGTGLVGWWAGISEDTNDPYGCIIHISAEHGRYVAKSYSPRQLATAMDGAPLFEIFFTMNQKGEYKQQAVYLKMQEDPQRFPIPSFKVSSYSSSFDPLGPIENKSDLLEERTEETGNSNDRDDESNFESALRDLIPGVKVKFLKVTTPRKVDKDLISKVVEQMIDEDDGEDEEKDVEFESGDTEDEDKGESEEDQDDIVLDADSVITDGENQNQIALKVVVNSLVSKVSSGAQCQNLLRVPATIEKKGLLSFTFTIEQDDNNAFSDDNGKLPPSKKAKLQSQRSIDHVMLDLAKFIGKGRIPMKVLKDVGELINLNLNQAQSRQQLSGSTTFNRIDIPETRDPLNGLYVGAHGLYSSEVIHLRHRFGQWKDDARGKEPPDVEFYEYVEAVKLTGDPYVPAGQIAFRAKVGKRYQLPHKGVIPQELGVIARYKGQGRLAESGFQNPRWVDGELVILDGKYIKAGPVVGFVYWAPEYHFPVFFNRLRLHL